ncbi:Aste57867_23378 [Aphanomyces stellatus]|uniref:Aste57867_23378 protein n=1 Tax=Aphanomyces stellatus TaxID=120398 RepID=A0A485LMX9_9STRA|nr:hypothetical protein As57867_023307 [Aphanomyces stellatus]VFU00024.1 Aste57867_23378 [Aphanomyces stellatus]
MRVDLFSAYAVSNAAGISRSELLALCQDHIADDGGDARFFEKLYTWLKRHFTAPTMSLEDVLALLESHATLLDMVQIDCDRLAAKLEANNPLNALPDDLAAIFD